VSGTDVPRSGSSPERDGPAAPAIVYLDVDDEITSAAARLRRIEAERIVFVLPYGSRLATSRINFRLLAREAANRGKHLEVVAADASARALAGTAGLTVHASVAALEGRAGQVVEGGPVGEPVGLGTERGGRAAAGGRAAGGRAVEYPIGAVVPAAVTDETETRVLAVPRSAEPVPTVGRARPPIRPRTALAVGLAAVLLVGVGALAAFLYLPSATIVLTPASAAIGPLSLTVEARTDVASPDPTNLVVPAREFSFDLQATETFTATGKKITDTKATGNVTFTNCDPTTDGAVTIPAGSKVATQSGVQFATLASLTIRRASLKECRTGSVAVEAVLSGPTGNVDAEQIRKIPPGYDSLVLFVTNPQPTSGGTHVESPQVSQGDLDAARAALEQALREDLDGQIAAATDIPAGMTLLEATKHIGTATPSVDPASLLGKEVPTFDLGLTAVGTVTGVDAAPVRAVAAAQLASRVTSGWQLVDGSTSIQVGQPAVSGLGILFDVTAAARQVRIVDHDALVARIRGLDVPAARALLDDYGQVEISVWPDWVTTIPGDTSRISLTIDTAAAGASPGPSSAGSSSAGPSPSGR
jgi:hypothetical protein